MVMSPWETPSHLEVSAGSLETGQPDGVSVKTGPGDSTNPAIAATPGGHSCHAPRTFAQDFAAGTPPPHIEGCDRMSLVRHWSAVQGIDWIAPRRPAAILRPTLPPTPCFEDVPCTRSP